MILLQARFLDSLFCGGRIIRPPPLTQSSMLPFALKGPYRIPWRHGSRDRRPQDSPSAGSFPRLVGNLLKEWIPGKLLSAYKMSQIYLAYQACATLTSKHR